MYLVHSSVFHFLRCVIWKSFLTGPTTLPFLRSVSFIFKWRKRRSWSKFLSSVGEQCGPVASLTFFNKLAVVVNGEKSITDFLNSKNAGGRLGVPIHDYLYQAEGGMLLLISVQARLFQIFELMSKTRKLFYPVISTILIDLKLKAKFRNC